MSEGHHRPGSRSEEAAPDQDFQLHGECWSISSRQINFLDLNCTKVNVDLWTPKRVFVSENVNIFVYDCIDEERMWRLCLHVQSTICIFVCVCA